MEPIVNTQDIVRSSSTTLFPKDVALKERAEKLQDIANNILFLTNALKPDFNIIEAKKDCTFLKQCQDLKINTATPHDLTYFSISVIAKLQELKELQKSLLAETEDSSSSIPPDSEIKKTKKHSHGDSELQIDLKSSRKLPATRYETEEELVNDLESGPYEVSKKNAAVIFLKEQITKSSAHDVLCMISKSLSLIPEEYERFFFSEKVFPSELLTETISTLSFDEVCQLLNSCKDNELRNAIFFHYIVHFLDSENIAEMKSCFQELKKAMHDPGACDSICEELLTIMVQNKDHFENSLAKILVLADQIENEALRKTALQKLLPRSASANEMTSFFTKCVQTICTNQILHIDILALCIDKLKVNVSKAPKGETGPLTFAITYNRKDIVSLFIEKGKLSVDASDTYGFRPLDISVSTKQLTILQELVTEYNANINMYNDSGNTALHVAIAENNIDAVRFLLESLPEGSRANVNQPNMSNISPLEMALKKGNLEIAKCLIQHGATLTILFSDRETTPLMHVLHLVAETQHAVELYSKQMKQAQAKIQDLLTHPVIPKTADYQQALASANKENSELRIQKAKSQEELKKLQSLAIFMAVEVPSEQRALINQPNTSGESPLISFLMQSDLDMVRFIVADLHADVDYAYSKTGQTVLALAMDLPKKRDEMVQMLVHDLHVNINLPVQASGDTLLSRAITNKNTVQVGLLVNSLDASVSYLTQGETLITKILKNPDYSDDEACSMIQILLKKHPELVNQPNQQNESPLLLALRLRRFPGVIKLFIDLGVDVAISPPDGGDNALITAVKMRNKVFFKYLAQKGVDLNQYFGTGPTPITAAIETGNNEIFTLLTDELQISLECPDGRGCTPLFTAIRLGRSNMVDAIIQKIPLTWRKPNYYGWTPLTYAIQCGNVEMTKLLLTHGANPNRPDSRGSLPIRYAIESHNNELIQILIEKGAKEAEGQEQSEICLLSHIWGRGGQIRQSLNMGEILLSLERFDSDQMSKIFEKYLNKWLQLPVRLDHAVEEGIRKAISPKTPQDMLAQLQQGSPILFGKHFNTPSHDIGIVLTQNKIMICNRGAGMGDHAIQIYPVSFSKLTQEFLTKLISMQDMSLLADVLKTDLDVDIHSPVDHIDQKPQGVGNCTWANRKSALLGLLYALLADTQSTLSAAELLEKANALYKDFSTSARILSFGDYLEKMREIGKLPNKDLLLLLRENIETRKHLTESHPDIQEGLLQEITGHLLANPEEEDLEREEHA